MSIAALLAPTRTATRRRVIALWLALLLPAMQALAGWHALSHVPMVPPVHPTQNEARQARLGAESGAESASTDERLAKLQACELCLTLAGVAHAAPPAAVPDRLVLRGAPVMAPTLAAPSVGVASLLAYQGRAPPISQR